ncbi:MAG: SMC-Scp complex subunit ScpB [Candidatus Altiarchaeota archaeon]
MSMSASEKALIEAALFVSGKNLSAEKLAELCGGLEVNAVREIADELVREYSRRDGGIEVFKAGKSYAMRIKPDVEDQVTHLIPETDMPKAMLKTLALIAYEQPLKQSHVVKIRGNRVYVYLKRLEELEFIERRPEGHTKILTTTAKFNKYFRINDSKELVRADIKAQSEEAVREAETEEEEEAAQTKLDAETGEVVKYENMK